MSVLNSLEIVSFFAMRCQFQAYDLVLPIHVNTTRYPPRYLDYEKRHDLCPSSCGRRSQCLYAQLDQDSSTLHEQP